ncbi:MAG TPA: hypothetical protein DCE41_26220, partial [Cytophagales bacterium]|nr:hypothetical protein [Cytophagales bacterium]
MKRTFLFALVSLCIFSLAQAQITTFPYQQNFDSTHDFTLSGVADVWDADTLSGTGFYTAYSGVGALGTNLSGTYSSGDTSYATSPVFDFSGLTIDPYVSFQMKYAFEQGGFFGSNGYLRMEISLDGGSTWSDLGTTLSGNSEYALNWYEQFGPYSWTDDRLEYLPTRHELTGAAGNSAVQFRFVFESDNGGTTDEGALIDELVVDARPANDAEFRSWSLQNSDLFNLGTNEGINITIGNQGQDTLYTIPFAFEVYGPNDTTLYEDTIQSMSGVDPGGFISAFSFSVDAPDKGQYNVKAFTRLADDGFRGDDTLSVAFTHRSQASVVLPYSEGFETVDAGTLQYTTALEIAGLEGGYYSGDIDDGVLFFDGDSASEGSRAACFTSEAFGGDQYLEMTFDFSAFDANSDVLNLSFDYLDDDFTSSFNDAVQIRGNSFGSYVNIFDWQALGATGWQNSGSIDLAGALKTAGQSFSNTTQIRFRHGALSNFDGETVCFDNIQLRGIDINAGVTSITTNKDAFTRTDSDSLYVELVVNGALAVDTVLVDVTITDPGGGQTLLSDSRVGTFQDSTFSADFGGVDLSMAGEYQIRAVARTTGDGKSNDDTLQASLWTITAGSMPYAQDFESVTDATYAASGGVEGAPALYYQSEGTLGRLQINPSGYPGSDGGKAAFLDSDGYNVNELILTVDASAYTTADSMVLGFALREYGDEYDAADQVYVRGSIDDSWVSVLEWNNEGIDGGWKSFTVDLSAALVGASQQFSATTQVKFSQNDNFPLPDDGLGVDEIEVYEVITKDVALVSLEKENGFDLSDTDTVTVSVTNLDVEPVNDYTVNLTVVAPDGSSATYSYPQTAIIAPTDTVSFFLTEVDFSAEGNYQVTATVVLAEDIDAGNDAATANVTHRGVISSLPFRAPFSDLSSITLTQDQSVGYTGVYYQTPDGQGSFRTRYSLETNDLASEGAAYLGGEGENELLFTVDLSGKDVSQDSVFINFAYRSEYDTLEDGEGVFIRGSVDDPWLFYLDWGVEPLRASRILGEQVLNDTLEKYGQVFSATTQIKFVQKGEEPYGDNGLMVDQLVIADEWKDLENDRFTINNEFGVFYEITLSQTITNQGLDYVDSTTVEILVEQNNQTGRKVVELFVDLEAGESTEVDLGGGLFSQAGEYTLRTRLSEEDDLDPFNNRSIGIISNGMDLVDQFPFSFGFENSDHYFALRDVWEIGVPAGSVLSSAFEGQRALGLNLDGDYGTIFGNFAYTPVFDLSEFSADPIISFALNYETESDNDVLWLEMRIDGGDWQTLGTTNYATDSEFGENWYNTSGNYWSGSSNGWLTAQHEITGGAGASRVQFRWRFTADASVFNEGVLIDDLQIFASDVIDVALYSEAEYNLLLATDTTSDSLAVNVGMTNLGNTGVSNFDIQYFTDDDAGSATYTSTLLAEDSVSFDVGNVYVNTTPRTLTVVVEETVDENAENDTVAFKIFSRQPATLPFLLQLPSDNQTIQGTGALDGIPNAWLVGGENISATNNFQYFTFNSGWQESYFNFAFDLSNQSTEDPVYLSFDRYAFIARSNPDVEDLNGVYVQGAPGDEWVKVSTYFEQDPIELEWIWSGPINLSPILKEAGQSYSAFTKVAFFHSYDEGQLMANLRNVSLEAPQVDFAITEQNIPASSANLTDSETIIVGIQNLGVATTDTLEVVLTVTDEYGQQAVYTRQAEGPWAVGESVGVPFQDVNLADYGKYTITVEVAAEGDENPEDNTITEIIRSLRAVDTFPFNENFEEDRGGFFTDVEETSDSWQWADLSINSFYGDDISGEYAWATNASGSFRVITEAYLYTPLFDMTQLSSTPVLSFLLWYDLTSPNYLAVEVSVDSGDTWEVLGNRAEDANADASLINNWESDGQWDGELQESVIASYPLTGLAGQDQVWFRFHVSSSVLDANQGVVIDAIQIGTELNEFPVVLTEIADRTVVSNFQQDTVSLSGVFSDPEGEALTYSVELAELNIIDWLLPNDSTLVLTQEGAGATEVTVTATDPDGAPVSTSFLFTINEAPEVVSAIADTSLVAGFDWTLDLTEVFSDEDNLRYGTLASPDSSVAYLSYLGGGAVQVVDGLGGGTVTLNVYAVDAIGDTTFENFSVTIDAAPIASKQLADTVVAVGFGAYTIDLNEYFTDPEGTSLSFSVSSSVDTVVTAALNGSSQLTVSEVGEGTASISIDVTDAVGAVATFSFSIIVASPPPVEPTFSERFYSVGFGTANVTLSKIFGSDYRNYTYEVSADPDSVVAVSVNANSVLVIEEIGKAYRAQITVTATNSFGFSSTYSFPLRLNSGPEVVVDELVLVDTSGTGPWVIDLDSLIVDAQDDTLTYSLQVSNTGV